MLGGMLSITADIPSSFGKINFHVLKRPGLFLMALQFLLSILFHIKIFLRVAVSAESDVVVLVFQDLCVLGVVQWSGQADGDEGSEGDKEFHDEWSELYWDVYT